MYFQIHPPSVSRIRAKLIIEKLSSFPENIGAINIFATGRTHSGKTTLGNRLLGIDYFLSTGRQDCTKEINLIEFSIGLKYFDIPGVCSDDRLENYNRVALNIPQVEDFPFVDGVTLARYKENQVPSEENLSISKYTNLQLKPDLIYYLIAPDKQFARGDRKYLRDLLKHHQNIIYVFNMFVNRQTGISYSATETNIADVTNQILKVHHTICGKDSPPVIVGVNCWTGEGISELLHQSQIMLGKQKGKVLEELIQYQQQKTPQEYVNQVKRELIRLYAHSACERPNGSDTCDQPLHQITHQLFDFLINLPVHSEESDGSIYQEVNSIVSKVFANPDTENKTASLEEKTNYILGAAQYILTEGIDSFNELIKTHISEPQQQGYELRYRELKSWEEETESSKQKLDSQWNNILSKLQELDEINNAIELLSQKISSIGKKLKPRIEDHDTRYFSILSRRHSLNSRIDRWKDRLNRYNANIDKINRSSARLTYEAKQSIEQESDYLDSERSSIKSEESYVDSFVTGWQREDEQIEVEKSKFNSLVDNFNQKIEICDGQKKLIQELMK